jgi:hypothetical protein
VAIAEACAPYRPGLKDEDSDAEAQRNLHLLAAAPELLEALRLCLEQLEVCGHGEDCDYCREAREVGEEAIRKARGEP